MKRCVMLLGIIALGAAILTGVPGCNTLQSITVQPPARRVFGQGQELDISGLAVTANYKKNSEGVTNTEALQITGYDKHRPGEQTITVTMNAISGLVSSRASATFTVTVAPVESISIAQPPGAASIKQGDDHNWDGLILGVKFEKDAVPAVTVKPGAEIISGYNKDRAGTQTITVDYYGKRAAFNVTVVGLDGIAVASPPRNTEYYTGEELDLTGLVVRGTWNDGSTAPVNITKNNISGYDITRGGTQNVRVSYSGKTAVFPVTFMAFEALSIDRPPAKTRYELGEALDITGLRVLGTWPGHSMGIVNNSRLRITGYDPLRPGVQRAVVTVGGQSDYFTVTVTNPFEGVWIGRWRVNEDVFMPVTFSIEGNAWSLQTTDPRYSEPLVLRGLFEPDSGTHGKLQCGDSRGTGEVTRDSSTVIRLKNNFFYNRQGYGGVVTLDKVR